MKRYLVIGNDQYYPSDFPQSIKYSSDDLEDAVAHAKSMSYDYKHVFDCDTREVVYTEDNW